MKKPHVVVSLVLAAVFVLSAGLSEAQNAPAAEGEQRQVSFVSADGFAIAGTYYVGREGKPGLVLLHMLNNGRESWKDLAVKLQKEKGYHLLAVDLRGHGQSTAGPGGKGQAWRKLSPAQMYNVVEDAANAAGFLAGQPGVDKARLGMIGASIGANAALVAAAEKGTPVKTLILLSPGLNYRGVQPMGAAKIYKGSTLFVAAKGDKYSADSCDKLFKLASDMSDLKLFPGDAHGTNLLVEHADLTPLVVKWLRDRLEN